MEYLSGPVTIEESEKIGQDLITKTRKYLNDFKAESDSGADEPICRAAIETQTQRTDTVGGKEMLGRTERMETYTSPYVKQTKSGNLLCDTESSAQRS